MTLMIKRTFILSIFMLATLVAGAQPAAVQNAAKAVFTLTTFNKDGSIHATSRGVFVGTDGEAISTWKPFHGAASAVVVDAKGNKMQVDALMGANELYDVCRFRVKGATVAAPVAKAPVAAGSKVWLLKYSLKKAKGEQISISSTEKFMDKFTYYLLPKMKVEIDESCPLVNQQGEVIGLLQQSETNGDVFSTDANFIKNGMKPLTGLSVNDRLLAQCGIRVALPTDYNQATLMLMMAGERNDSANYVACVDEFISKFPTKIDGYTSKARMLAAKGDEKAAQQLMLTALDKSDDKAVAHSEYAGLIYQRVVYNADTTKSVFTLPLALSEARKAYEISPQPQYRHQEAQILFAQREYQSAYDAFMGLTKTPLRNGEIFYEAAQCKSNMKAPFQEVVALLDSAVAACPKPLNAVSAPYILARGVAYDGAKQYRKALVDYNMYDTLLVGRAAPTFYYTRAQCELQLRAYKQAINDLAHAAVLNPAEPIYFAELASVQLRVGEYDRAIKSADLCISRDANAVDAYIIKGVALCQSNKKQEGIEVLLKAKEMGDKRADEYIKKFK